MAAVRKDVAPPDRRNDVVTSRANNDHAATQREPVEYVNDEQVHDGGDDNDDSRDEDADIYRVPNSNEPLQNNVPFGSNVLYKVSARS